MFQKSTKIESEEDNYIILVNRLRDIFKMQNVIIYILTFLVSCIAMKNSIMPFGLAMIAAGVGENIPLIGIFVGAILGTALSGGLKAIGRMIAVLFFYFVFVLIFKSKVAVEDRDEYKKTGGKLIAASIIVSLIKCFIQGFVFSNFIYEIIVALFTYAFYKIFVNGLAFIKNYGIKAVFTAEELIASMIIFLIASSTISMISYFGINLFILIVMFMIMAISWKYGAIVGMTSGTAASITMALVECYMHVSIPLAAMFILIGLFVGILRRVGKIFTIICFIILNIVFTYFVKLNSIVLLYYVRTAMIASICLIAVTNNLKISLEDLIGNKIKYLTNIGEHRLEPSKEEKNERFKEIYKIFDSIMVSSNKDKIEKEEIFLQDFLDKLEEYRNNIFYEVLSVEENNISREICKVLLKEKIITDSDMIEVLKNHNNFVVIQDAAIKDDLQEIVKMSNRLYKTYEQNDLREKENKNTDIKKDKEIDKANIQNKDSEKVEESKEENKSNLMTPSEKKLLELLNSRFILAQNVKIRILSNKKYLIHLNFDYTNFRVRESDIISSISSILSKHLGIKVVFQKEFVNDDNQEYCQVYSSEDKFVLQVGNAKVVKDSEEISSECTLQTKLSDGKYFLAIADAYGESVEVSRENSKKTLKLIKQVLSYGFDNEVSLKVINGKLTDNFKETKQNLDAIILDLFAGKINILNNSNNCLYIKNKRNVQKIILNDNNNSYELKSRLLDIYDGDIFILCSDGILESTNNINSDWIEESLKNVSTNNVQKVADYIINEAIEHDFGIAREDMTVIVSKVVKKNK